MVSALCVDIDLLDNFDDISDLSASISDRDDSNKDISSCEAEEVDVDIKHNPVWCDVTAGFGDVTFWVPNQIKDNFVPNAVPIDYFLALVNTIFFFNLVYMGNMVTLASTEYRITGKLIGSSTCHTSEST